MKRIVSCVILIISALIIDACQKPDVQMDGLANARVAFTQKNEDEARSAFAKTLAKALVRKELRDFLKAQALEQFDEDYDVLFHAQKNKKIVGNTTLFELLASYHGGSKQDFIDVIQSLPKLTILVPELLNEKFYNSASTWDTEHIVPKVAALGSNTKQTTIDAYDSKGKSTPIKTKGDPDELILVVKDNERIEVENGSQKLASQSEKSQWDYLMTDGDNQYYFSSPNFNRAKRKGLRLANNTPPTTFENRSHYYRPEAPRGYAYYKSYYSNGQLILDTSQPFAGQLDYTVKDRMGYIRFTSMAKIQSISENWAEGNLELYGRALIGGRVPEAFTNVQFASVTFERLAAQFTVPGFAEQVESGWGSVCVPNWFWGCHMVNPYQDKLNEYRNTGVLWDNRSASANSGIWISWNQGAELFTWDAEDFGNRAMLVVKEKDDGATYTQEYTWSTGLTATIGKKDGSNLSFTGNASGKTTVTWKNDDDDLFQQLIDYNGQYGVNKPAVNAGDTEFILRVY